MHVTKGEAASEAVATDTTSPSVTTTSPAGDATGIPRAGNIAATFSEPVTGVSSTTMTLRKASTGSKFAGAVSYDLNSQTATLDPNVTLPSNTTFTVTLSGGVADTSGNHLAATAWSFTTGS